MNTRPSDLATALAAVVAKIDAQIASGGYDPSGVTMFVAGGLAVHYYCHTRYTHDIDASFSHSVNLQTKELLAPIKGDDGRQSVLYFDPNYNPTFALMHPDFRESSKRWENFGDGKPRIKVNVLSPVDLAVSKLSRFSEQDQEDILTLASLGLFTEDALRLRALEAMDFYIGNMGALRSHIDYIVQAIKDARPASPPSQSPRPPQSGDYDR